MRKIVRGIESREEPQKVALKRDVRHHIKRGKVKVFTRAEIEECIRDQEKEKESRLLNQERNHRMRLLNENRCRETAESSESIVQAVEKAKSCKAPNNNIFGCFKRMSAWDIDHMPVAKEIKDHYRNQALKSFYSDKWLTEMGKPLFTI